MTDAAKFSGGKPGQPAAEQPVRDSEAVKGSRGDQEAPPAPTDSDDRLAAAEAKAQEHLDDLKRLAADFENYKKRAAREQANLSARAAERLVNELLPIVDDLERALEAAEEHEEAKLEEGVRLVHRQLAAVLEREGLAEIETDGRFDPHVHEALLSQPVSDRPEGSVIEVLQKGYRLGDRVLRPARVVVAAPAQAPAGENAPAEGDPGEPQGSRGK